MKIEKGGAFPRQGRKWDFVDKPFRYGGLWGLHGRPFDSYMLDFKQGDKSGLLADALTDLRIAERPVVIDLLAPTQTLRDLKRTVLRGKEVRALAVGRHDQRTPLSKQHDARDGIDYRGANLANPQEWETIPDWLQGDTADLMMSRGCGGLGFLPTRLRFYNHAVSSIWDMLRPNGGTAVLQIAPENALNKQRIPVEQWSDQLNREGIPCDYTATYRSPEISSFTFGLVIFQKQDQRPLPTLRLR